MSDPESFIISARVVAVQQHGRSTGQCMWGAATSEHCPVPAPDFFCPAHVDSILSSEDLDVLSAWGRLQGDIHRRRKASAALQAVLDYTKPR